MGACDKLIKQAISQNCANPITKGLEANGLIVNRQDIDFAATVFDATKKNVIKTLVLKTGKQAYEVFIPGSTPFTGTKTSMEKKTYQNTFTNECLSWCWIMIRRYVKTSLTGLREVNSYVFCATSIRARMVVRSIRFTGTIRDYEPKRWRTINTPKRRKAVGRLHSRKRAFPSRHCSTSIQMLRQRLRSITPC